MLCAIECNGSISMSKVRLKNWRPRPKTRRHEARDPGGITRIQRGVVETGCAVTKRVRPPPRGRWCHHCACPDLGGVQPKARERTAQPLSVPAAEQRGKEWLGKWRKSV